METTNILQATDQLITRLKEKGTLGTQLYEKKLKDNINNNYKFNDLLFEGQAALLFLNVGFKVTFRDRPDLKLELGNEVVYAEVKHFWRKKQDQIDDDVMVEQERKSKEDEEDNILVPISDTRAAEGMTVWEQIACVAIRKAKAGQYMANAPNILLIESDSASTSLTLSSAAHEFQKRAGECPDPLLRRLNALIMINRSLLAFGDSGPHNIEYYALSDADVPMSNKLISVLSNIRLGQ